MSFGQSLGPPASRRQIETLTELIRAAGHADFRDARGPLRLTQRQAGGKFTRDEAEALIEQLEAEVHAEVAEESTPPPGPSAERVTRARDTRRPTRTTSDAQRIAILREVESELLAAELQRRGWVVLEP